MLRVSEEFTEGTSSQASQGSTGSLSAPSSKALTLHVSFVTHVEPGTNRSPGLLTASDL